MTDWVYKAQDWVASGIAGLVTGFAVVLIWATIRQAVKDRVLARQSAQIEDLRLRTIKPKEEFIMYSEQNDNTHMLCRVERILWMQTRLGIKAMAECSCAYGLDLPLIPAHKIIPAPEGSVRRWIYVAD